MKTYILAIIFLIGISFTSKGQKQKLPTLEEINLNTPEDHLNFQDSVMEYIDWLESNSLKNKNRKAVNAVFLKWIIHTPSVSITIEDYIREYAKENEELLILFMAGYSKYILNNPSEKSNQFAGNLAGINTMLDYYTQGRKMNIKKDDRVEKLLKIREIGLLDQYLERQLN